MLLTLILVFLISYHVHGLGVTVGYHRLLAHRSFRCNKLVEWFLVTAGYLALEGPPIWWAGIHRVHHKYADQDLDPHTPLHGKKWSYYGWIMKPDPPHVDLKNQCRDLFKDPYYAWIERTGDPLIVSANVGFRLILWLLFGWQVALVNTIAALAVLQMPLILNTFCHIPKFGYKTYDTKDNGVNVWWVGYLVGGEGWHNNHHAFPGSARHGFKFFEADLSYGVIRLLQMLGLASRVNLPAPHLIKR
jgi:sn-1 stearoyl-lipid 9-desaturase